MKIRLLPLRWWRSLKRGWSLNATITGLKFFFDATLDRADAMARMQPVRVPHTLPVVLSREEVARLIAAAANLKRQTALTVSRTRYLHFQRTQKNGHMARLKL